MVSICPLVRSQLFGFAIGISQPFCHLNTQRSDYPKSVLIRSILRTQKTCTHHIESLEEGVGSGKRLDSRNLEIDTARRRRGGRVQLTMKRTRPSVPSRCSGAIPVRHCRPAAALANSSKGSARRLLQSKTEASRAADICVESKGVWLAAHVTSHDCRLLRYSRLGTRHRQAKNDSQSIVV